MPRIARGLTTAFIFAVTVVLLAQATPQQYLNDAKQALDAIATTGLSQDNAKAMSDLKRDFADLQGAYAAASRAPVVRPPPPAAAGNTAPVSTGQQVMSDWQNKYSAVHTDLILVGDIGGQAKGQLDQFRARLERFYNAALDQSVAAAIAPPPQTPAVQTSACPSVAAPVGREAVSLLDRMQTLVDDALAGKVRSSEAVATSGSKEIREAGQVTIGRASLVEMRAEVAHLKLLLQESSTK